MLTAGKWACLFLVCPGGRYTISPELTAVWPSSTTRMADWGWSIIQFRATSFIFEIRTPLFKYTEMDSNCHIITS
jgi:hypothetical protein